MSSNWERPSRSEEDIATFERDSFTGQGHDRIHGDDLISGISSTVAMAAINEDVDIEITAGQKMLSAMSGSLLTSLLGETDS